VKDYKGDAAVAEGEAFDPTPANIEQRVIRKALPFGLKLAMLPKRNRGNTIHAEMMIRFGDEKSLAGRSTSSLFTFLLMMQGGTSKHTARELTDSLGQLKSRVTILPIRRWHRRRIHRHRPCEPVGHPGNRGRDVARAGISGAHVRATQETI
jgi:hypothetical protein